MAPARHLPPSLRTTGLMLRGPTYRLSILTSHSNASAITSNSFSSFSSFSSSSHSKHTPSTPYSLPLSKPTSTSIPARQPTTSSSNSSQRLFSTSSISHSGGGHSEGDSFNPPGGWLWGIPPGEKYQREGWERIWGWGMGGVCVVAVVGWVYKPDTSIQTWALEEARRRLEAEGILPDPYPSGTSPSQTSTPSSSSAQKEREGAVLLVAPREDNT